MDSLAAKQENVETLRWFPPRKVKVSLASRTSARYLAILFSLLLIAVPLQLYAWIYSIEAKKTDDLIASIENVAVKLRGLYISLSAETTNLQPEKWSKEQVTTATSILDEAELWNNEIDRLEYHVRVLNDLSFNREAAPSTSLPKATASLQWYEAYGAVNTRSQREILTAINIEATAGLIAGVILSFLLPILFGMIGALTFVIRTMSEQIKASTFSTTSPIRHLMRVTLGALGGVVVGLFSNLSNQLTLPPLAIAFLAGYGVEALFSMFDGFIAKFKSS
jgi:hypothetical protein